MARGLSRAGQEEKVPVPGTPAGRGCGQAGGLGVRGGLGNRDCLGPPTSPPGQEAAGGRAAGQSGGHLTANPFLNGKGRRLIRTGLAEGGQQHTMGPRWTETGLLPAFQGVTVPLGFKLRPLTKEHKCHCK